MEQLPNGGQENANKIQGKIYIGMAIIILSPVLGSLLFMIYGGIVGKMISNDEAVAMFWFSCILITALLGLSIVLIGCNEKVIDHNAK